MNCSARLTISGGDALTICCRNEVISSLASVPFTVISLRCEASAFIFTDLPGVAKMGCSEKLGNTSMRTPSCGHGLSYENRPPSTRMVSSPFTKWSWL